MGAGVYASHLMDPLLDLAIKGLPDSEYVFLNVDTGVYGTGAGKGSDRLSLPRPVFGRL